MTGIIVAIGHVVIRSAYDHHEFYSSLRSAPGFLTTGLHAQWQAVMNTDKINAHKLSSRKLWQLAETSSIDGLSDEELSEVITELAKRCQDSDKLEQLAKLEAISKD